MKRQIVGRVFVLAMLAIFAFGSSALAANFEIDSMNVLPDGSISSNYILYARISPARGAETDTCINAGFALSMNE